MNVKSVVSRLGRGLLCLLLGALGWEHAALAQSTLIQQGPMKQRQVSAGVWQGRSAVGTESQPVTAETAARLEAGRKLYEEGVLPSGGQLKAQRYGQEMSGASVACASCHRPSGLGSVEGTVQVSPITGRYLFDMDRRAVVQMHVRTIKSFNEKHEPYTEDSLAAAIRGGVHVSGRPLHELMPRYALGDEDLAVLTGYLRQLSSNWSPGVSDKRLRIATVITPDVDASRRRIFLDTIQAAVSQKNSNVVPGQRSMSSGAQLILGTERFWEFEVWELTGAPEQWAAQLERKYAANPVFALVSGLGQGTWAPVHSFCESRAVPCWFPSVEAPPPDAADGRYSVYFSRGIALEAATLSQFLTQAGKPRPTSVTQWATDDATGHAAADALQSALEEQGIPSTTHFIDPAGSTFPPSGTGNSSSSANVPLVAWLRPVQMAQLDAIQPPSGAVYFSGLLARGDPNVLPLAWRARSHLVYPYQTPARRAAGLTYFHQWLQVRQLPLSDEVLQAEVYFALNYFNETLVEMLDNLHRDYLLERAESMLSLSEASRAEDEARELVRVRPRAAAVDRIQGPRPMAQRDYTPRPLPGRTGAAPLRKESTTIYPRLSLGPRQRIASRGAQLVGFEADLQTLFPETPWIIPQVP
jgi:hypothetical protein